MRRSRNAKELAPLGEAISLHRLSPNRSKLHFDWMAIEETNKPTGIAMFYRKKHQGKTTCAILFHDVLTLRLE